MNSVDQKMDDYREKRRKHPASNAQLLAQAVASFSGRDGEGAIDNPYWEAVRILHCRADDDLMGACRLFVRHSDETHRRIAANILAQGAFRGCVEANGSGGLGDGGAGKRRDAGSD